MTSLRRGNSIVLVLTLAVSCQTLQAQEIITGSDGNRYQVTRRVTQRQVPVTQMQGPHPNRLHATTEYQRNQPPATLLRPHDVLPMGYSPARSLESVCHSVLDVQLAPCYHLEYPGSQCADSHKQRRLGAANTHGSSSRDHLPDCRG